MIACTVRSSARASQLGIRSKPKLSKRSSRQMSNLSRKLSSMMGWTEAMEGKSGVSS